MTLYHMLKCLGFTKISISIGMRKQCSGGDKKCKTWERVSYPTMCKGDKDKTLKCKASPFSPLYV